MKIAILFVRHTEGQRNLIQGKSTPLGVVDFVERDVDVQDDRRHIFARNAETGRRVLVVAHSLLKDHFRK